jgi:hypothetical protein
MKNEKESFVIFFSQRAKKYENINNIPTLRKLF